MAPGQRSIVAGQRKTVRDSDKRRGHQQTVNKLDTVQQRGLEIHGPGKEKTAASGKHPANTSPAKSVDLREGREIAAGPGGEVQLIQAARGTTRPRSTEKKTSVEALEEVLETATTGVRSRSKRRSRSAGHRSNLRQWPAADGGRRRTYLALVAAHSEASGPVSGRVVRRSRRRSRSAVHRTKLRWSPAADGRRRPYVAGDVRKQAALSAVHGEEGLSAAEPAAGDGSGGDGGRLQTEAGGGQQRRLAALVLTVTLI
ncbi:hypothetical protein LR48_Vigan04g136000 [Vigna angularis]|uniref:Uncharacterized protein n=1 Tax=Phaseolus angularis TaxID=3914 RepID=A0A0L9UF24_PHAAN|nr:hypothetical protein LR48_Vigan04g136000 [Vigna angularis]